MILRFVNFVFASVLGFARKCIKLNNMIKIDTSKAINTRSSFEILYYLFFLLLLPTIILTYYNSHMLHHGRNDIFEGTDINRTIDLHECKIHYNYFFKINFGFQPCVYEDCHDCWKRLRVLITLQLFL